MQIKVSCLFIKLLYLNKKFFFFFFVEKQFYPHGFEDDSRYADTDYKSTDDEDPEMSTTPPPKSTLVDYFAANYPPIQAIDWESLFKEEDRLGVVAPRQSLVLEPGFVPEGWYDKPSQVIPIRSLKKNKIESPLSTETSIWEGGDDGQSSSSQIIKKASSPRWIIQQRTNNSLSSRLIVSRNEHQARIARRSNDKRKVSDPQSSFVFFLKRYSLEAGAHLKSNKKLNFTHKNQTTQSTQQTALYFLNPTIGFFHSHSYMYS